MTNASIEVSVWVDQSDLHVERYADFSVIRLGTVTLLFRENPHNLPTHCSLSHFARVLVDTLVGGGGLTP